MPNTKPRPQREAVNPAEQAMSALHIKDPDNYGPLGSMVIVYCRDCHAQPTCDRDGCIRMRRAV